MQLDKAANLVINEAITKRGAYMFRETDEMCPVCQHDLEIYYCENQTYMLRCSVCDFVAITRASCPEEAAEKVGLKVKPVRHGRWEIEWRTTVDYCTGEYDEEPTAICPFCDYREYGSAYGDDYWAKPFNYCPNCGTKMDMEVCDVDK